MKFYYCKHCKNLITHLDFSGVNVVCCNEKMELLVPNTHDGDPSKHKPVVNVSKNLVNVTVGEVIHPMVEAHYIEFIILETNTGYHKVTLGANKEPKATFVLANDELPVAVYTYCNIHGLWSTEI